MGWTQTYNAGPTRKHIIRETEGDPLACGTCGWYERNHPRVTGSEYDEIYGKRDDRSGPHEFVPREPIYRVLDYAATFTVAWMAVECLTDFPYGKGKIFAAITTFHRSRDGSITTKELSETMGIVGADTVPCPLRIIEKLSPVDELYGPILSKQVCDAHYTCAWKPDEPHPNQRTVPDGSAYEAAHWRDEVRAYHAARLAKPKVKAGDRVRFAEPQTFTNGDELSELEFVKGSTFRAGYKRYRITRWRDLAYSVVG